MVHNLSIKLQLCCKQFVYNVCMVCNTAIATAVNQTATALITSVQIVYGMLDCYNLSIKLQLCCKQVVYNACMVCNTAIATAINQTAAALITSVQRVYGMLE